MHMRVKIAAVALAAFTLTAANAYQAMAEEAKTLKVAWLFPANHYLWENGGKVFADAVTERTDGKIQWELYPAGQLGNNIAALKAGLADAAMISTSYHADKFPLSSVAELPGMFSSSCESTEKMWGVAKPGGILDNAEYKIQGFRVIFAGGLPPYNIFTTDKAIETIDDVKGLKLRANGEGMSNTARSLGAVPIKVSSPETYDALTRGVIDGALYPYSGLFGYKLNELFDHVVEGSQLGSGIILWVISDKAWNSLSDETKNIFTEEGAKAQSFLCEYQDRRDTESRQRVIDEGMNVVTLTEEQQKIWQDRVSGVWDIWVKKMEDAGRKGKETLEAYKASGN